MVDLESHQDARDAIHSLATRTDEGRTEKMRWRSSANEIGMHVSLRWERGSVEDTSKLSGKVT